jgi:DNA polymerase-4
MKHISSSYFIPRDEDPASKLFKRVRTMPLYSFPHFKDFDYRIKEHKDRYFIHIDFDSFYAQVEQRDNPMLQGKPVAVGGSNEGKGIVMTASKEARAMGVDKIMSVRQALQICPDLICLPSYGPKYEAILLHIMEIIENNYVPPEYVEQYSIDECFIDISPVVKNWKQAELLARQLKADILHEELLTVSLGLSYNKTYAKLGTKTKKNPDYFIIITPENKKEKLYHLKVSKMWGIGSRIEKRLYSLGIKTVGELAEANPLLLKKEFGINGILFYRMARGEDTSGIYQRKEHEKTLNHHHTLNQPLHNLHDLLQEIRRMGEYICRKLRAKQLAAKNLVLAIRYPDLQFSHIEGELPEYTNDDRIIYDVAVKLFEKVMRTPAYKKRGKVRMFGITVFDLKQDLQRHNLSLYENRVTLPYYALDKLKEKYGDSIIRVGVGKA